MARNARRCSLVMPNGRMGRDMERMIHHWPHYVNIFKRHYTSLGKRARHGRTRQANGPWDRGGGRLIVPTGNPIQHPFEEDLIQAPLLAEGRESG